MISGSAGQKDTRLFSDQHPAIGFNRLGRSGLLVSAAGFGCYRVSHGFDPHAVALGTAVKNGVNLIDTSTNYADGGSEQLVGAVLKTLIQDGECRREQIVVVSKAGYLQGSNYALSQERKQQGKGFPDLVTYTEGLEHCIHPEFLEDQLTRSLERLSLERLDVFLLHNPEYYLNLALREKIPADTARKEYNRRLHDAFEHLEKEVARGRISWYGVSSNTFPAASDDPAFTSLADLLQIAGTVSENHHMAVIQLPLNLLEPGAVLQSNQPQMKSVLELAREKDIGVLVNRPLNAIRGERMMRLADIPENETASDDRITTLITLFKKSEKRFVQRLLPRISAPVQFLQRLADQVAVADQLKHYWRNFGTYERWREVKAGFFLPRVEAVLQYVHAHAGDVPEVSDWAAAHEQLLREVSAAVGSLYAEAARQKAAELRRAVCAADSAWCRGATLSQMAIRAIRSTSGVSSVLVGMRDTAYVNDVLEELRRPVEQAERKNTWQQLVEDIDG